MDGLLHHSWIRRHKLDVRAYHRMAEAGIFREDDRVELIEGEVLEMAPIGPDHSGVTNWLANVLPSALGGAALLVLNNPLRLDDGTEPQPDAMFLKPRADFYRTEHPRPANVLLLIEVARSSLVFDRDVKLPLYARHGIAEYWIVDLVERAVQMCRTPRGDGYDDIGFAHCDAVIAPAALPGIAIPVAGLLG